VGALAFRVPPTLADGTLQKAPVKKVAAEKEKRKEREFMLKRRLCLRPLRIITAASKTSRPVVRMQAKVSHFARE
jgi:hypothetical protein